MPTRGDHSLSGVCRLLFLASVLARAEEEEDGGARECWMGALTFETCCRPPPQGNPICWDQYYTPERCCRPQASPPTTSTTTPLPPLPLPAAGEGGDEGDLSGRGVFGGCEWAFFQEFKTRAATWYMHRRATLSLFHQFSSIVNQFDDVFGSCPAAALTAMLLKLESVYFEAEPKFSDLLEVYVRHEHRAVAEGTLEQSHHRNGWPLVPGLNQILSLRALGRRPAPEESPTQARVAIVVCYCAERLAWLRALHKLPWREEDRSAAVRRHVSLSLYHKCGGPGDAVREAERSRLVADWAPYFSKVTVRYVDDAVRADDCSAYLSFIADHYDELPEFAIFLHADAPEHVPSLDLFTDAVFAAARGYLPDDLGFLHLAHNYVLHDLGCEQGRACEARELDGFEFPRLWRRVFGSSVAPSLAAGELSAYCCVQFLVRSSRVRQRPREFYDRALAYFGTTAESYHQLFPAGRVVRGADALGRTPCQLAMYIWHVIFGEPLQLPRRQRDPAVPLFLKLQNIEIEALDEEGGRDDPMVEHMVANTMLMEQGPLSVEARVKSLFN